jgi:hypothetical protein
LIEVSRELQLDSQHRFSEFENTIPNRKVMLFISNLWLFSVALFPAVLVTAWPASPTHLHRPDNFITNSANSQLIPYSAILPQKHDGTPAVAQKKKKGSCTQLKLSPTEGQPDWLTSLAVLLHQFAEPSVQSRPLHLATSEPYRYGCMSTD